MIWQTDAPLAERPVGTAPTEEATADAYAWASGAGPGATGGMPAPAQREPGRRLADRLRDELLTVVAHDLVAPLMILDGHTRLLRQATAAGGVEPEALASGLTVIERQVARLTEIAELVREYLGWEERPHAVVRAPTDLGALLTCVVAALQQSTGRPPIELVLPPAPIVGCWDARRLAQVYQNLLDNALKYSPDGGPITVAVRTGADAALVCVRDQGVGLPASALPHLFERGYRVTVDGAGRPTGSAYRPAGSGLGLYLCRRIVEAHGGRIWAESAGIGTGSTFWVSLPYADSHES